MYTNARQLAKFEDLVEKVNCREYCIYQTLFLQTEEKMMHFLERETMVREPMKDKIHEAYLNDRLFLKVPSEQRKYNFAQSA